MSPKSSLKKKLLFFFFAIGILPLVFIVLLTTFQAAEYLRMTAINNLTSLASEVTNVVKLIAQNIYLDIELLASSPVIRAKDVDVIDKLSEMQKIQDYYKVFEDITLIDVKGNVLASTNYLYRGEWITSEHFQQAKNGETAISPIHIALDPFKVIIISATPVKARTGEIIGVIAAQFNMETIWQITDTVSVGEGGSVFMVDGQGNFIAHPEKGKILSRAPFSQLVSEISSPEDETIEYTNENGEKMIAGITPLLDPKLSNKEWKVIVVQPQNEAFEVVNLYQRQAVILFIGLLIFIMGMNILLTRNIVNPIRKLTSITKDVIEGRLEVQIETKTGDEIEELAISFNQMTQSLKKSKAKLEEANRMLESKVKDRTQELQARIDELEKFHKVTVGREKKMMDLKKEIERLREEIEKRG